MKRLKTGLKITIGLIVLVVGLIMMPIPGPGGTPITLAGLAILASELPIAGRVREWFLAMRAKYYNDLPGWQRAIVIVLILAAYVVMTIGLVWIWKYFSHRPAQAVS